MTTWCEFVSVFRQVTVSPTLTVTSAGTNPVRVIVTVWLAAVADPSAVSARAAATAMKSVRMFLSLLFAFSLTGCSRSQEKAPANNEILTSARPTLCRG